jgi:hypothetical protein
MQSNTVVSSAAEALATTTPFDAKRQLLQSSASFVSVATSLRRCCHLTKHYVLVPGPLLFLPGSHVTNASTSTAECQQHESATTAGRNIVYRSPEQR